MSLLFLLGFIAMLNGSGLAVDNGIAYLVIWALFSIADAMWVRVLFKK